MTLLSKVASTRKEGDINERSRLEDEIIRENEAGMKKIFTRCMSVVFVKIARKILKSQKALEL